MKKTRKKIVLVAGARPNFMKIAPILREAKKYEDVFEWRLVHTGQHYDHGMSSVFFEELGIPAPDLHMGAGAGSHAEQTARIMIDFEKYCHEQAPDLVMVVGDVNSTLASSIVAKKLGIAVAHVEAGLRSGDMRMPEEVNRRVTDSISDLFFVTEPSGIQNLKQEGHKESDIHFVGHVMIDNLYFQLEQLKTVNVNEFDTESLKKQLIHYGVVTMHRPSNVDDASSLAEIVAALSEISRELPLIFPVHPRTNASIKRFDIEIPDAIHLTPPLPYMEFLNLWKDAQVILTDSGGLQEETTALGIPCLTLRENTERPVTLDQGTNKLVGKSKERILSGFHSAIAERASSDSATRPDLWDGKSAERILKILRTRLFA